jgi:hypothetical protein
MPRCLLCCSTRFSGNACRRIMRKALQQGPLVLLLANAHGLCALMLRCKLS